MNACMYVRIHVCMYMCSVRRYACMPVRTDVCLYVGIHVCMYMCAYACMYVRFSVCVYVCMMHICMHAGMHAWVNV